MRDKADREGAYIGSRNPFSGAATMAAPGSAESGTSTRGEVLFCPDSSGQTS